MDGLMDGWMKKGISSSQDNQTVYFHVKHLRNIYWYFDYRYSIVSYAKVRTGGGILNVGQCSARNGTEDTRATQLLLL